MVSQKLFSTVCASALFATQAYAQQTQLYWGDTHLHTNYSPDAYALMTETADPDASYRFAKGLPVIADLSRARVKIDTPLDFLVVTDHAEFMGVIPEMAAGNEEMMQIDGAPRYRDMLNSGQGGEVFFELMGLMTTDPESVMRFDAETIRNSVWESIVDTAETHNDPGNFTAFIGWEWTSLPEGRNLHRIIFTPDAKDKAMQYLPYSALVSTRPRDLYNWLDETAAAAETEFVAIAHNMNLSAGTMFPLYDEYGNPVDAEYAEMRERWEPVAEVLQYKGDSETHAKLSPNDPFADFETYEHALDPTATEIPEPEAGDYARTALMRGLQLEATIGKNPFKFGMVGATDSHTAFSSVEETNFLGKYALDSIPENKTKETVPGAVGWDAAAQGLAGVWATENTREAITAAFKRKEVYATSGPRIALRVFGGYDFAPGHAEAPDIAAVGYRHGVPMGGDLAPSADGSAPSFLIHAAKDPKEGNLDRMQVVKGWLKADGTVQERIYDVALSDGRTDGSVPVGNTVDLETGTYTNDIGDPELVSVWTDPDFDPGLRSFYYVRVLQIPTPRHSTLDAIALGIDPEETNKPTIIQDRVYSSPIWYTPSDDILTTVAEVQFDAPAISTVEQVVEAGFTQMTSDEIQSLVGQTFVLTNLVSGQSYRGVLTEGGRRIVVPSGGNAATSAQGVLHGGNPILMGDSGYSLEGDTIVTSDGLRRIVSMLYTDGERILAARDIDDGRVNFEVTVQ